MESPKTLGHILTSEGVYFEFDNPEAHPFKITEMGHALSHTCRFTGHCRKAYYVSYHSVLVSYLVPKADAFPGLMHDGSEAYLGDVSSPLKAKLPEYKVIEVRVEKAIAAHFNFPFPHPPSVKVADMRVLMNEKQSFMPIHADDLDKWPQYPPIPGLRIKPLSSWASKHLFLTRYKELTGEKCSLTSRLLSRLLLAYSLGWKSSRLLLTGQLQCTSPSSSV